METRHSNEEPSPFFKEPFAPEQFAPLVDYAQDFWQRSIIFLDILRQSGNQQAEMTSRLVNSVLIFDFEVVLNGNTLPRPVNYSLVRVLPPEGVETDERKRPLIVVDPRAGQGPGIGGFKPVSEIGDAFTAGHPVYFIGFTAEPLDGQTIEDIAHAHTIFFEKVIERHPDADGKPFLIGNCQAGWHVMTAACMRPELVGLVMIAGAPLSYWAGVHGVNPMRYAGGLLGGSWLATLTSDLGDGIFDGSWLVANFNNLNPANTLWSKQYNVWKNPEQEQDRYLGFEKWWGDFINLRGEEMAWMLDNLFIGNKLSTAQIVTQDGQRLDLRDIKAPIICFCSKKDNITPPQQALDWIIDNYRDVDEIRKAGQTILYCIHETAGHLAIFVGTNIAAKEHAEFINLMDLIDCMTPGLYEIVVTVKTEGEPGEDLVPGDFDVRIEPRGIEDILAFGSNSPEDEREFATVAHMATVNEGFYRALLQPWVRAMTTPQTAKWVQEMNPLRLWYSLFSNKNPLMSGVETLAAQALEHRKPLSDGNPFLELQEQFSKNITQALEIFGDIRDRMQEQIFHAIFGSPLVQAFYGISADNGPPRPRPGQSPAAEEALAAEIARLTARLCEGGPLEAAARAIVYIIKAAHQVDARSFEVLNRLIAAHPDVTLARAKAVLREQWAILAIDEPAAVAALPQLAPQGDEDRRALTDMLRKIVTAAGTPSSDVMSRLTEVEKLLDIKPARTPVEKEEDAGENTPEENQ
ncbi:MAG: DUF3141 domain-containing protein [Desulfopila sp.]